MSNRTQWFCVIPVTKSGDGDDITEYVGSAGGNGDYSSAAAPENIYWVDDVTVTAPDHCQIFFPNQEPVGTEYSTFGGVKALYR